MFLFKEIRCHDYRIKGSVVSINYFQSIILHNSFVFFSFSCIKVVILSRQLWLIESSFSVHMKCLQMTWHNLKSSFFSTLGRSGENVQVELPQAQTVTGVVTQGAENRHEWTTSYQVLYGNRTNALTFVNDLLGNVLVSQWKQSIILRNKVLTCLT